MDALKSVCCVLALQWATKGPWCSLPFQSLPGTHLGRMLESLILGDPSLHNAGYYGIRNFQFIHTVSLCPDSDYFMILTFAHIENVLNCF